MAFGERITRLQEVEVEALDAARLEPLIGPARMARFEEIAEAAQEALEGSAVLNVNSTASGGGVAEMLQTLLAYVRGAGVDARWLVIEGDPDFFAITKRIHKVCTARLAMEGSSGARSGAITSACCAATPRRCSRSYARATSRSCTIPSRPGCPRR